MTISLARISDKQAAEKEVSDSGTLLDGEGRAVGNEAGVVVPLDQTYSVVMTSASQLNKPKLADLLHADEVCMDGVSSYDLVFETRLGGGSFGCVWLCTNVVDSSALAVKEVAISTSSSASSSASASSSSAASSRKKYVKELRTLYKAREIPHVVRFAGAFFLDHSLYICMEYMDRGDLGSALAASPGPLPLAVLKATAYVLVSAIAALKEVSLMHRDIKPDNVLINSAGQIKLADFGESGELLKSRAITVAGNTLYAAPETLTGAGSPYTVKADLWSTGMTLLEMALRYHPLIQDQVGGPRRALTLFDLHASIIHSPPPALESPHPEYEGLGGFVARMLVQDAEERASVVELLGDEFLSSCSPSPSPSGSGSASASASGAEGGDVGGGGGGDAGGGGGGGGDAGSGGGGANYADHLVPDVLAWLDSLSCEADGADGEGEGADDGEGEGDGADGEGADT